MTVSTIQTFDSYTWKEKVMLNTYENSDSIDLHVFYDDQIVNDKTRSERYCLPITI